MLAASAFSICPTPKNGLHEMLSTSSPSYSLPSEQLNAGMSGLALLLAIKQLRCNPQGAAIAVERELQILTQLPEPDMRRIIRTTLSFLSEDDFQLLTSIRHRIERFMLFGEEQIAA